MTPKMIQSYSKYVNEMNRRSRFRAVCPWCLYMGTLDGFSKMSNKFEMMKKVECPDCKNGMMVKTTRIFDDPDNDYSWPNWFWEQVFMWGGYEKVRWEKVKTRMKPYPRLISIYWDCYRDFKNDKDGASDSVHRAIDEAEARNDWKPLGAYTDDKK